jgi:2-haloacid dehalogenase
MHPRPGLSEASQLLLSNGFRLLAATNGSNETTKGYFEKALGKTVAGRWGYFSCDEDKVAKPGPTVYRDVWRRLGFEENNEKKKGWFVASHSWCASFSLPPNTFH